MSAAMIDEPPYTPSSVSSLLSGHPSSGGKVKPMSVQGVRSDVNKSTHLPTRILPFLSDSLRSKFLAPCQSMWARSLRGSRSKDLSVGWRGLLLLNPSPLYCSFAMPAFRPSVASASMGRGVTRRTDAGSLAVVRQNTRHGLKKPPKANTRKNIRDNLVLNGSR